MENQGLLKKEIRLVMQKIDDLIVDLGALVEKSKGEWSDDLYETYNALYDETGNFNAVSDVEVDMYGNSN